MDGSLKVLILDTDAGHAERALAELKRDGGECDAWLATSEDQFVRALEQFDPKVILAAFHIPGFDGMTALALARTHCPDTPFIFVADAVGEERVAAALKGGAADYVLKTSLARLSGVVRRALDEAARAVAHQREQERISRLNRIYAVLNGVNSAIIRVGDRDRLFREVCAIAVNHGLFRMAWIGVAVPGATKVRPVAWVGADGGYLDDVGSSVDTVSDDHGIAGQALRGRRIIVANDIAKDDAVLYKKEALERGFRSLVALPLVVENAVVAVFLIYAGEPDFFAEEELKLLDRLAGDVSFALAYIDKEVRLNYLAYYDGLTGLSNRNLLHDRLAQAVAHARRHRRVVAVIFVDLDEFKLINDRFGHGAGDLLMKTTAQRLHACVREGDTVSRYSGDEFVIVMSDQPDEDSVSQAMLRILASVSQPIAIEGNDVAVTCSIGASFYPRDGRDTEALLRNADAAMYRAKTSGRNRFQFYGQGVNARVSRRLSLEDALRHALKHDELALFYQPEIDLTSGQIVGAEALVRWRHPDLGLISAARLVELAQAMGLIGPFGEWTLRAACRQAKAWQDAGCRAVGVSVNLSARQLSRRSLPALVARTLRQTGLDAPYLGLDMAEAAILQGAEPAVDTLKKLRSAGLRLSLDDFGAGNSSLMRLKSLPLHRLKIAQGLVRGITASDGDVALVRGMIGLAHALGLIATAKGVENDEQTAILRTSGCDEAQGFHFGKPVSAADFDLLLKREIKRVN
jgi:diguanylate cyclase (GGDEF)-like protein